jgi:hypothetical protein
MADWTMTLAILLVPAVLILPWRVRFRMQWGIARLAAAIVIVWPIVAVVGVRAVDAEYAAVQAEIQAQRAQGITPDPRDLMFDGTGDRLFFTMAGFFPPTVVGWVMLGVRYLIDLWLYRKQDWAAAASEREWREFVDPIRMKHAQDHQHP